MSAKRTRRSKVERLSRERWCEAALSALADGGLNAVAIEPLAKALGVTKGSGYWHFENREALLQATLETWEAVTTARVIERLQTIDDPRARLASLFRQALTKTLDARVYLALTASDHHPTVALVLRRVSAQRLAYLQACYQQLGDDEPVAHERAVIAYAAYLGLVMLRRHAGSSAFGDREAVITRTIATLVTP